MFMSYVVVNACMCGWEGGKGGGRGLARGLNVSAYSQNRPAKVEVCFFVEKPPLQVRGLCSTLLNTTHASNIMYVLAVLYF